MKKLVLLLLVSLMAIGAWAEEKETRRPSINTEISRKVYLANIEGELYTDVTIKFKSNNPGVWVDKSNVKVTITDSIGKQIYKKTLKDCYLYIFSTGEIQVANGGFKKLLLIATPGNGKCYVTIREKEGVY